MFKSLSSTTKALLVGLTLSFLTVSCAEKPPSEESNNQVTPAAPEDQTSQPPAPSEPTSPATPAKPTDPLELTSFTGDFKQYQAGDVVPDLYRTAQYNISKWSLRKLPAPSAGSHWTYFGGCYVLISDAEGKISRIFSGDIIYR